MKKIVIVGMGLFCLTLSWADPCQLGVSDCPDSGDCDLYGNGNQMKHDGTTHATIGGVHGGACAVVVGPLGTQPCDGTYVVNGTCGDNEEDPNSPGD